MRRAQVGQLVGGDAPRGHRRTSEATSRRQRRSAVRRLVGGQRELEAPEGTGGQEPGEAGRVEPVAERPLEPPHGGERGDHGVGVGHGAPRPAAQVAGQQRRELVETTPGVADARAPGARRPGADRGRDPVRLGRREVAPQASPSRRAATDDRPPAAAAPGMSSTCSVKAAYSSSWSSGRRTELRARARRGPRRAASAAAGAGPRSARRGHECSARGRRRRCRRAGARAGRRSSAPSASPRTSASSTTWSAERHGRLHEHPRAPVATATGAPRQGSSAVGPPASSALGAGGRAAEAGGQVGPAVAVAAAEQVDVVLHRLPRRLHIEVEVEEGRSRPVAAMTAASGISSARERARSGHQHEWSRHERRTTSQET